MDVSLVRVVRLFPTLVVDNASEKILVQDLRCIFIHSVEQFLTFTNIGHGVQCKRHGRFQWQFLGNCGSIRHVFQTDHYTDTPWEHSTFVQRSKAGATFADEHGRIWNFLEIRKAHRVSWSSSLQMRLKVHFSSFPFLLLFIFPVGTRLATSSYLCLLHCVYWWDRFSQISRSENWRFERGCLTITRPRLHFCLPSLTKSWSQRCAPSRASPAILCTAACWYILAANSKYWSIVWKTLDRIKIIVWNSVFVITIIYIS